MAISKIEWGALAALIAVTLFYYSGAETEASAGAHAVARADGDSVAMLQRGAEGGRANCSGTIYASPFGQGSASCATESPPALATQSGNATELRSKLARVEPCRGTQQANDLTPDCVALNSGAASLVRQLEALVEQGEVQASGELSAVIERERKANTASGEYLDELERAEALLLRIAASGGIEAERKIVRPVAIPAEGPRFANQPVN
ncbi:MAG: hypothetical protein V4724_32495 [Pseudomonadota bacterium]